MTDFVTWFIQQIWWLCCVPKDHSACWLKLHHNGMSQYSQDLFTPVRICWMLWNGLSGFDCRFLGSCVDCRFECFHCWLTLHMQKLCLCLLLFFTCHLFSQPGVWKPLICDFLVTGFCPFVVGSVTLTKFQGHCGVKIHQLNFTFLSRFFSDCVQIVYGC